jgi:hypothetical protein
MDCHGRVFYIDHKSHKTTWQKPWQKPVPTTDEKGKSVSDKEQQLSDPDNRTSSAR